MANRPAPVKAPRHPNWEKRIIFRSANDKLAMFVHGTGRVTFGANGTREVPDVRIEFRGGKYIADGERLFRIMDPITEEETVMDEVTYMLSNKLFELNGGVMGSMYWIERGHEDARRQLENMLKIQASDPDSISVDKVVAIAAAIGKVKKDAEKKGKPSATPVVHGPREARVSAVEADNEPAYGDMGKMTAGLKQADEQFQNDLRRVIRDATR